MLLPRLHVHDSSRGRGRHFGLQVIIGAEKYVYGTDIGDGRTLFDSRSRKTRPPIPAIGRLAVRSSGALMAVLLLGACSRPSRDECARVVDRYVDLKIDDDPEVVHADPAERAEVRKARLAKKHEEPVYAARVDQCVREVDRGELECGMKAPAPNEWEACFH